MVTRSAIRCPAASDAESTGTEYCSLTFVGWRVQAQKAGVTTMQHWSEPTSRARVRPSVRPGHETSRPTSPGLEVHQISPALRFLLVVYVGADWQQARATDSGRWSDGIAALQAWCGAVERRRRETPWSAEKTAV